MIKSSLYANNINSRTVFNMIYSAFNRRHRTKDKIRVKLQQQKRNKIAKKPPSLYTVRPVPIPVNTYRIYGNSYIDKHNHMESAQPQTQPIQRSTLLSIYKSGMDERFFTPSHSIYCVRNMADMGCVTCTTAVLSV